MQQDKQVRGTKHAESQLEH